MRVADSAVSRARAPITRAEVVCDPYHRELIGLSMIGSGCRIHESLFDAETVAPDATVLAVITSVPETALEALGWLRCRSEAARLQVLTPLSSSVPRTLLDSGPAWDDVSLHSLRVTGSLLTAEIRRSGDADRDIDDLLAGMDLGTAVATSGRGALHSSAAAKDMSRKLASLERRYQALAHSKLGAFTLWYWRVRGRKKHS